MAPCEPRASATCSPPGVPLHTCRVPDSLTCQQRCASLSGKNKRVGSEERVNGGARRGKIVVLPASRAVVRTPLFPAAAASSAAYNYRGGQKLAAFLPLQRRGYGIQVAGIYVTIYWASLPRAAPWKATGRGERAGEGQGRERGRRSRGEWHGGERGGLRHMNALKISLKRLISGSIVYEMIWGRLSWKRHGPWSACNSRRDQNARARPPGPARPGSPRPGSPRPGRGRPQAALPTPVRPNTYCRQPQAQITLLSLHHIFHCACFMQATSRIQ